MYIERSSADDIAAVCVLLLGNRPFAAPLDQHRSVAVLPSILLPLKAFSTLRHPDEPCHFQPCASSSYLLLLPSTNNKTSSRSHRDGYPRLERGSTNIYIDVLYAVFRIIDKSESVLKKLSKCRAGHRPSLRRSICNRGTLCPCEFPPGYSRSRPRAGSHGTSTSTLHNLARNPRMGLQQETTDGSRGL